MRIVVVGATGNTGTSLLPELARDPAVDAILGVARRLPELQLPKTDWAQADVESDDLTQLFRGADAVVHLAWAIQPSRDQAKLRRTNVSGSSRVFRAVADAGVGTLVYASSVGAYSRGPKDRAVDEAWPVHGIGSSFYSRHKAEVEGLLDLFERERPEIRVARLRPGLIFKREAASGVRRLFAGPFLVNPLLRPGLLPVVPRIHGLRFQAVHTRDVAAAYRLAILREDARGAYNVAADPVLDPQELGRILGARPVPVPTRLARGLTALTWRLHVQPTPPGWLDSGWASPSWTRAGPARSSAGRRSSAQTRRWSTSSPACATRPTHPRRRSPERPAAPPGPARSRRASANGRASRASSPSVEGRRSPGRGTPFPRSRDEGSTVG